MWLTLSFKKKSPMSPNQRNIGEDNQQIRTQTKDEMKFGTVQKPTENKQQKPMAALMATDDDERQQGSGRATGRPIRFRGSWHATKSRRKGRRPTSSADCVFMTSEVNQSEPGGPGTRPETSRPEESIKRRCTWQKIRSAPPADTN